MAAVDVGGSAGLLDALRETLQHFLQVETGAIVEFARRNEVDHIVMGARSASTLRRYLGSVSAQVVAESDCTVTVVRDPAARDA